MIYPINPTAKPRMTQRDKWLNPPRRAVAKYWAFKNLCALLKVEVPRSGAHVIFRIEMPKSWSKKKKDEMNKKPHQSKKDIDNLLKALLDAVYKDDSCVWDVRITKLWGYRGGIKIEKM